MGTSQCPSRCLGLSFAVNWGIIAVFQVDYIAKYLPYLAARIIYGVIGLAGVIMLIGCLIGCAKCDQPKQS